MHVVSMMLRCPESQRVKIEQVQDGYVVDIGERISIWFDSEPELCEFIAEITHAMHNYWKNGDKLATPNVSSGVVKENHASLSPIQGGNPCSCSVERLMSR